MQRAAVETVRFCTVHLDPYMLELEASEYVRHDSGDKRYYLTQEGEGELA